MTDDSRSDRELLVGLPRQPELMGVLYERHATRSGTRGRGTVVAPGRNFGLACQVKLRGAPGIRTLNPWIKSPLLCH
jgi:hypothetical protein